MICLTKKWPKSLEFGRTETVRYTICKWIDEKHKAQIRGWKGNRDFFCTINRELQCFKCDHVTSQLTVSLEEVH